MSRAQTAEKKVFVDHFNHTKSKILRIIKTVSGFMASKTSFHEKKSQRTLQINSVASAPFGEKLHLIDQLSDATKQLLRDAHLVGHNQQSANFVIVNDKRKTCRDAMKPIADEWTAHAAEGWPGETKIELFNKLIEINGEFVTEMKHLRDAVEAMRKDLTATLGHKDFTKKLAEEAVKARLEEIRMAPPSPTPGRRASTKAKSDASDDDDDDEEELDAEDLGDQDSIVDNDDDDDEDDGVLDDGFIVNDKKSKKRLRASALVAVDEKLARDEDAETSSEDPAANEALNAAIAKKIKTRYQPARRSAAIQKLIDEQTAADAAYQEDFLSRQARIEELRLADASNKPLTAEEENGVIATDADPDDEEADFDANETREEDKARRVAKKKQRKQAPEEEPVDNGDTVGRAVVDNAEPVDAEQTQPDEAMVANGADEETVPVVAEETANDDDF